MKEDPEPEKLNRAKYSLVGLGLILTGAVILFLCNYDDYHFYWLLSAVRVSLIFGFVMLSISIAPSALAGLLLQDRSAVTSLRLKPFLACLLWVGSFMVMGIAFQIGLETFDDTICECTARVNGTVVELDTTLSRGGSVEWAVYEYTVGGSPFRSAVRNKSLRLQPGQPVGVCYTPFWPRHGRVRPLPHPLPSG